MDFQSQSGFYEDSELVSKKETPLMDEPGGHYAKWQKPDTEGQIWHDTIYRGNLK